MTAAPSESDLEWLVDSAAASWLALAGDWQGSELALATRLRKDLPAERSRLVMEQTVLRRRACEKFGKSSRMFFTARGLEQASDEAVARYKASRFGNGAVVDLCCGIGGDLMALAAQASVTGVERDSTTARFARTNLRVATDDLAADRRSSLDSRVVTKDARTFSMAGLQAWHIDPDRRPAGRRTTRVEFYDPGPEVIKRMLDQCPTGAVKLAPAAVLDGRFSGGSPNSMDVPWVDAELEWISRKHQCRQLVAWFGSLAQAPRSRRATVVSSDLSASGSRIVAASFVGMPGQKIFTARDVGRYLFEPDAAVLAADLTGALAADLNLQAIAGGVAYLTADEARHSPLLAAFEVIESMPYRATDVKKWLRARGIGRLVVKKRGVGLDPARVARELAVAGDASAILFLCRRGGRISAIVTRRLETKKESGRIPSR